MAYGANITEPIVTTIGNPVNNQTYAVTGVAYDVSVGGQPFFLLNDDAAPYRRVTAQYRKQQLDTTREPGEQTLTGWWLRSQSSFHLGQGIKFFEPAQDESLRFQYTYSKGCDIWTKGQVSLLKDVSTTHLTTGLLQANGRPFQFTRSIKWSNTQGVLLHDEYDVDKIAVDGTLTHFIDYTAGTDYPVYAICDDGVYAYWITKITDAGVVKTAMYKKLLTADSTVADTLMWKTSSVVVSNAVIEYTKERLILALNNSIYELTSTASALGTAVYTHPDTDVVYTSVTSSGAAIYVSAFSGIQSNIYKFTLGTNGAMPTLTYGITAAELPVGEVVYKASYYLGLLAIGTSKGLRIANVSSTDGSLAYGPLIFESEQPVYDLAFRDRFLWCATNVDGNPGLTRVNLGQEITSLVYAYAWDLYDPAVTGKHTTACAFAGDTSRLVFTTDKVSSIDGKIYIEEASKLVATGTFRTGFVRYNTLENKIFKYITPRFDTTNGGMNILSIAASGQEYTVGSFAQGSEVGDVGIAYPPGAQQYLGFEFIFSRSTTNNTLGPLFTGYQLKVLPAIPRQRLIQFPFSCYDSESDKFGNKAGYDGYAYERVKALESIESNGDTLLIQDNRTNETFTGIIEEIDFQNKTPSDKRYSGYGGMLLVTVRSIS